MVNTCQQVGGSIGTALLNTIAASALSSYLVTHGTSPAAQAGAAVHSYVVTFWVVGRDLRRRRRRVRAGAAVGGAHAEAGHARRPRPRMNKPRTSPERVQQVE